MSEHLPDFDLPQEITIEVVLSDLTSDTLNQAEHVGASASEDIEKPLESDAAGEAIETATTTPTVKAIDPGITLIRKGGQKRRGHGNKKTRTKRRQAFEAERREAAAEEAASVSEDVLKVEYLTFTERYGRKPSQDDILSKFRGVQAAKRAEAVLGDYEKFQKQVDEDKAWDDYHSQSTHSGDAKAELDALPQPENELSTLYEKRPADWSRDDVIAIYSAFSKHNGHWLSGAELQELCKVGTIPARYQTLVDMFGNITQLCDEARHAAVWYQAQNEREKTVASTEVKSSDIEDAHASSILPELTQSEIIDTLAAEVNSRGELYAGIVNGKRFPRVAASSLGRKIELTILNDTTFEIDGRKVNVDGHKLFALNALLLTRGEASTPQALAELGFDPRAKLSELTTAIRGLSTLIKRAASGDELISKWSSGKMTLFGMSPNLTIADSRSLRQKMRDSNRPKVATEADITQNENMEEFAEFESSNERDLAIATIVKKYRNHPIVLSNIESLKANPTSLRLEDNEVNQYFNLMKQFALLDAAEERELFKFIEEGLVTYQQVKNVESLTSQEEASLINLTVAQQMLFLSNLRLVVSIARPMANYKMLPLIDLIQEGNLGLNTAISRFDYGTGYKLSTYATWWIRQNLSRAMADKGRTIRMPVHAHDSWLKLGRDRNELSHTLNRDPTDEELARYTGLTASKVHFLQQRGGQAPLSMNKILDTAIGDSGNTLADYLPDPGADMDVHIDQLSALVEVRRLFASSALSDREKLILGLRFGTYGSMPRDLDVRRPRTNRRINYLGRIARISTTDGLTLDQVGKVVGVTRERIRQIEVKALDKSKVIIESRHRTH